MFFRIQILYLIPHFTIKLFNHEDIIKERNTLIKEILCVAITALD